MSFSNSDFDRHFARTEKLARRTFKAALVAWVLYALLVVGLMGAAVFVAIHFLSKVW